MPEGFHSTENKTESEPVWRRRWIGLALIWGIWTLVALFFTSQTYFTFVYAGHPMPFWPTLSSESVSCYLLALVTPLILRLARRFPIERQNWKRSLPLHILVSILLGSTVSFVDSICAMLIFKGHKDLSLNYIFANTLYNLDREMEIYWLIVLLSLAFNYYSRYRKGVVKAAQLESMLAQSQLQALKMQLNPHFLFNTLHSISALMDKDTKASRKMITLLGDFLRITLENSGTQEVTLQQEMEFLSNYLEIERIRFRDRLTTHFDVTPEALDAYVPNLILQPIVENAIRHGIAPRSTPGQLEIRAERRNGTLRIQVRDDGPGLALNKHDSAQFKEGLGIANTRARLRKIYGPDHRFELRNDPEGGLVVTIEIPVVTRDATCSQ